MNTPTADSPYCNAVQQFLAQRNLTSVLDLLPEDSKALSDHLTVIGEKMDAGAAEYLRWAGVSSKDKLSASQLIIYYDRLQAVVAKEDHYP